MGLPLGHTFANGFMWYHENIWLTDCPVDFKPILYQRYVDDTFLLFKHRSHANLFLNYLNSKHSNIKFTCDFEVDGSLSFLNLKDSRKDNKCITSVYRKSTFKGLGTSFSSFECIKFKLISITTLLSRAYKICFSFVNLHDELIFFTEFLICNGYPETLLNCHIKKFLSTKYTAPSVSDVSVAKPNEFLFHLPFFGCQSEQLRDELLLLHL